MIETANLLPDLQELVKLLHGDLIKRSQERNEVAARLQALHTDRQKQQRSAQSYEEWREEFLTQVAVAWVLACVFVRYLEDNRFLRDFHLAGPDENGLRRARDNFNTFMHAHPDDAERNYLLDVFRRMQKVHAVKDLFSPGKTALWAVEPSNAAAMKLLDFWHEIDTESGDLKRRFDTARGDTRFLGDLYQNLSADIREKYALLQTPVFVEEFILDRTLEPAIADFGFEKVRLIDPTCGSGHFLLGAFSRLFCRWEAKWQETGDQKDTNLIDLAQRALNQVYGVDINPYAVAICRFRLIIAAMNACAMYDLERIPDWKLNVAVGDSLYYGKRFNSKKDIQRSLPYEDGRELSDPYELDDVRQVNRILSQQYHVIVGNPPYIIVRDKNLNKLYRELYSTCYRQFSLGIPFTERFFDLALVTPVEQGPGYVGMITTNSFMKREFGKVLIEQFLTNIDLTDIIDTSGAYIPGHGTPTVILFGRNRTPVGETVRAVLGIQAEPNRPEAAAEGKVWRSIMDLANRPGEKNEFVNAVDMERTRLAKHPWSLGGGGASDLKAHLDETSEQTLGDLGTEIGRTTHTGEDGAFFFPTDVVARWNLSRYAVPMVTGDDVRDWLVDSALMSLFPYDPMSGEPITPKEPQWNKHFWAYRRILKERRDWGQHIEQRGLRWFDHSMFFPERFRSPLSISFAVVATHNHFVLERGKKLFNRHAPSITLPTEFPNEQYVALLGLLNSSTACFWMQQVFHNKGRPGAESAGADERWEFRFEFSGTQLERLPLPPGRPLALARQIDALASEYGQLLPAVAVNRCTPTSQGLVDARSKGEAIREQMIALQEELDWQCYYLYGLTSEPLTYPGIVPLLHLGERAFEIIMARKMERKELETAWFTRHASKPITDLPVHWPEDYRRLVERRIQLIDSDNNIGLIERPENKRRWNMGKFEMAFNEAWRAFKQEALKGWLLDRLETDHYWPRPKPGDHSLAELKSCRELARLAELDSEFQQVGELYTGSKAFDMQKLVTDLMLAESVPFLPILRYTDSGLRKRQVWKRVWEKQRAEDRGEQVEIEVPPKYKKDDFQKDVLGKDGLWRLRGELDVPKERWISYPPLAERQGDEEPSPVVTWAGYNQLDQALALAKYFDERKDRDTGSKEWMLPLLAGLEQLLPWLFQWYNDPDPAYEGQRMGDYFRDVVLPDALQTQGLTIEQCCAWRPPAVARKPRSRKSMSG